MTKLSAWLKKQWLELVETAKKKAREAFVTAVGLALLGLIYLLRDSISTHLTATLSTPIARWSTGQLAIFVLGFVIVFSCAVIVGYFIRHLKKQPIQDYFFVEFSALLWKTHRPYGPTEKMPYCLEHKSQLFTIYPKFFCESCDDKLTHDLNWELIKAMHDGATSKAKRILYGHDKAEVF